MVINDKGLALIKSFEGCKLNSYQDTRGIWTIGYGHTKGVTSGQTITQDQAEEFLREDLKFTEDFVSKVVHAPINSDQFSALVSFTYNVGVGNLEHSTLLKKLNNQDYSGAADEFLKWDRGGPGIPRRRQAERALFTSS